MKKLHSVYKGHQIYRDDTKKRRPWSVFVRQHGLYAAKASLEACKRMIDQMEEEGK